MNIISMCLGRKIALWHSGYAVRAATIGNLSDRFLFLMDITAPLYWWKEFDTYKVATVANSTSTMHKIHASPFSFDDFSCDHMTAQTREQMGHVIAYLEQLRQAYVETKDKKYWYDMIQFLPSSYQQMRTVTMNYETLRNIYHARKNHKLEEWHDMCRVIEQLPYADLMITDTEEGIKAE